MRPIVQFLSSKLSGMGVRVWTRLSPVPTLFPAMAPGSTPGLAAGSTVVTAFVAVALVLLIVGVAVKLYDRSREREDEAVELQARLSEALMGEPSLTGLPLTPTVRRPLWRRGPVMIDLSGSVPRPGLRQAAVNRILREVDSMGKSCCLQDRIVVAPAGLRGAA